MGISVESCPLGAITETLGCKLLFDAMDEGIALHRLVFGGRELPVDARFLYVNPKFQQLFGITAEQARNRSVAEVMGTAGAPALGSLLTALRSGKPQRLDFHSPELDRWFLVSATPLPNDQILTIFFDITERKQAAMALAREHVFNEALMDSIPGILYVYDAQYRLIRWNRRHETDTGYTAEELYLKDGNSWFEGEDLAAIQRSQENIREVGYNVVRANLICKSGERKPFLLTAVRSAIRSEFYFMGVGIDISDLLQAEKDRAELERQLMEAQKLETLGRLAGGIAHDFNNLLTVISGYGRLALPHLEDKKLRSSVSQICKAADRAADLTSQLLAFSRRQIIKPRPLSLNASVREMEGMLQRLIGEDIHLTTALHPDLGRVLADPGQIHQILMNLAANARDAMPHGGKILIETANAYLDEDYTKTHPESVPGQCVMLAMTDTGAGMTEEVRQKVFEPFFTTKERGRGTGLGLATVYGIVRQSGGWIWVYSEPGNGTTFKIYLPRTESAGTLPEPGLTHVLSRRGTETVLIAEDQEAVRDLMCTILESSGYRVLAAETGEAAVRIADSHAGRIGLLLTDVILPGINGRQVADLVQARHPETRVLFSSGYTENVIANRGVLKPGVFYLAKPFSPDALLGKVEEILGSTLRDCGTASH